MSEFWLGVVCGGLVTALVLILLRALVGRAIDKLIAYFER